MFVFIELKWPRVFWCSTPSCFIYVYISVTCQSVFMYIKMQVHCSFCAIYSCFGIFSYPLSISLAGHFKSLLDLSGANSTDHLASRSDEGGGGYTPPPRPVEPTVSICINDVTVDSTDDFSTQDSDTGGDSSIGHVKKTRRRSSWCPEEGRKQEEKREKQRMLGVQGRR